MFAAAHICTSRRRTLAAFVAVLLLWRPHQAHAQRYTFREYAREDGLGNLSVTSLLQDRTGFVWAGTQNGLYRYDGSRFERFGSERGLPSNYVAALHETSDGVLWIATWAGLAYRDGDRFVGVDAGMPVRIETNSALSSSADGRVYAATNRGVLRVERVRNGSAPNYQWISTQPARSVRSDADGFVWFDCGTRVCRAGSDGASSFGAESNLPDEPWSSVVIDRTGTVWARGSRSLYRLPRGARHFAPADEGLPHGGVLQGGIVIAAGDVLLVPTSSGLAMSRPDGWNVLGVAQGLPDGEVTSVLEDREGSIWLGFLGAGIARWIGRREWASWTTSEGLTNNTVWTIQRDRQGRLWAGTSGGLNVLDAARSRWSTSSPAESLLGESVRAVAAAPDDTLWVGTAGGGVKQFDRAGRLYATYGSASGLAITRIEAIEVDTTTASGSRVSAAYSSATSGNRADSSNGICQDRTRRIATFRWRWTDRRSCGWPRRQAWRCGRTARGCDTASATAC